MKLQAKFNLAMAGAFVLGLGLAAILSWQVATANARREVLQQAALIASEGDGVSIYTDQEIGPLLAKANADSFAPQTIPFLAAQNPQAKPLVEVSKTLKSVVKEKSIVISAKMKGSAIGDLLKMGGD